MKLRDILRRPRAGDDDIVLPAEQRFQVGDREVVVRPLTLAEIRQVSSELGQLLERIAREHPDLDLTRFDEHLTTLVPMLAGAVEELLGALFGIEADYLMEHLTPVQAARILRAMLEVNQLPLLRREIGRIGELVKTAAIV